jgi:hypothetical protein
MYHPPAAPSKRVFWGFVRIAFVLAALILWLDEHSKVVTGPIPPLTVIPPSAPEQKPMPDIDISWAGKPLDGQSIKVNPGGFGLDPSFDFQSNVEISHPSTRMMFSTRFSVNGSIWQYTGQVPSGFVEGVQWYSDRSMYANQPWQGPEFSGGWTFAPGDEKRSVRVRLELYYDGPSSPKIVNFRLVPGA